MKRNKRRNACLPWSFLLVALLGLLTLLIFVPVSARLSFGNPDHTIGPWQGFLYSFELVLNTDDLTQPVDSTGVPQVFTIDQGESVDSISGRLEQSGLIRNGRIFRTYLVWTGIDTNIQPGTFHLSPGQTGREIAGMLRSATLTDVTFNVLPGWRMEEIGASLPSSGLDIQPVDFLRSAGHPISPPAFIPVGATSEGFLAPGAYSLPRETTADGLVSALLGRFSSELTVEMQTGFTSHGLTIFQAVTLASIVQREAMVAEEMPTIASVFYNRLAIGMPLQSDPTVQYSTGYNTAQGIWWTNPLSAADMTFDSPYNTYLYPNLPPGPISNPGTAALEAVANPATTGYYFFQAKCDGSGLHNFSETFAQHQANYCP